MKELHHHIEKSPQYLGDGILKADAFINHQLLPGLTKRMGKAFEEEFTRSGVSGVTKIITAEVSGIGPALATAMAFDVPMVFARKKNRLSLRTPLCRPLR